ncbi:MAG: hypothetical protein LBU47_02460 [Christensenellaceae bacterium]|jgi:hypothetical protein|nr:hypothetical protein [Christensenellaceae bacterium]
MEPILSLEDLRKRVLEVGFLPFMGRKERLLFPLTELTPNAWFTGEEGDPWGWRMELAAGEEIAYGKFFLGQAGFIAAELLPCFIALRRKNWSAEEIYEGGLLSREAFAIYRALEGRIRPSHEIRREVGAKGFDHAAIELQMKMLIVLAGEEQKLDRYGRPYGWASAKLQRLEERFPCEQVGEAEALQTLLARAERASDAPQKAKLKLLLG